MDESKPENQEGIDKQLIEDISQIEYFALGEGAGECQVCEKKFREGDGLVLVAFRVADRPLVHVDHAKCLECRHEPTEYFTRGTRDVVVEGRVGCCTDVATQSSWRVLLAPELLVSSPADSMRAQPRPGTAWFRKPIARSNVYEHVGKAAARKPWQRPAVRVEGDAERASAESGCGAPCRGARVNREGGAGER